MKVDMQLNKEAQRNLGCKESTKKNTVLKTKNTKARKNFNNCFGNK